MNVCPLCRQVTSADLLTVKLDGNTIVYHGCLPCWDTKVLAQDPIRRALWNFCSKHLTRAPMRKGIDDLLKETDGNVTAAVALRIVEFSQATKNPKANLSDLVAAERRAKMKSGVIVGGASDEQAAVNEPVSDDPVPGDQ